MKKALKITGICIGSLLILVIAALLIIPTLFKDNLLDYSKKLINEQVNAKVDFADLNLSFLSSFPNLSISLEKLSVIGVDKFADDTLASIRTINLSVNWWDFLFEGNIDVRKIGIEHPHLYAKVLNDGTANWDIMKPSEEHAPVEMATDSSDSKFNLQLQLHKFYISEAAIVYDDEQSKTLAVVTGVNCEIKGNMHGAQTELDTKASIDTLILMMDGTKYVSNMRLSFDGLLGANFEEGRYTLDGSQLKINDMALGLEGNVVNGPKETAIDIKYNVKVPSLAALIDLIPKSKMREVGALDTKGTLTLSGWVKGAYGDKKMPVIALQLAVNNGYISYADLPETLTGITIDTDILFDANQDNNTYIDLKKFAFSIGNSNPFSITASVRTPLTDANIKSSVHGELDLKALSKAFPLDMGKLEGNVTADVNFAGRYTAIEQQKYDKLTLNGHLRLDNFMMISEGMPPVNVKSTTLDFTPKEVHLSNLDIAIGQSDLQAKGSLENFLNFILKDETIKGNLTVTSSLINLNDFSGSTSDTPEPSVQTTADARVDSSGLFILPKNINCIMSVNCKQVIFDKLDMRNVKGSVSLANSKVKLENLQMNLLDGNMTVAGEYMASTPKEAFVTMNLDIKNIAINNAANSFSMFEQMAPILKDCYGKFALLFNFAGTINDHYDLDLYSLTAYGKFSADQLQVKNENFTQLLALIKVENQPLKNIGFDFLVKDGKVIVNPFDLKLGSIPMKIGGEHGLDQHITYYVDANIPSKGLAKEADKLAAQAGLSKLNLGDALQSIPVGVKITGTLSQPKFSLGTQQYGIQSDKSTSSAGKQIESNVKEEAQKAIDDQKKALEEKATKEVEKVKEDLVKKAKDQLKKWF
jgi:hypothetical protein